MADYGQNSGESLTELISPTGASQAFEYDETAGPLERYSPIASVDDRNKRSTYAYNDYGNQTNFDGPDTAVAAEVEHNPNGTIASATAPGNTASTGYQYNTRAQLSQVDPVPGSSLGVRNFTYDTYGRVVTETNGRGITTTYTYDLLDRTTGIGYSGTTANPDVSYHLHTAGRLEARVDASGTTDYAYDDLGQLTERTHSGDAETVAYTYDKASRIASTADGRGATTYGYDSAGALIAMETPNGAGTGRSTTKFAVDEHGWRTDTWMGVDPTDDDVWLAHQQTTYDDAGRPTNIKGEEQNSLLGTYSNFEVSYCYGAGTYPNCDTSRTNDRSFVNWRRDHHLGTTTVYLYDDADA